MAAKALAVKQENGTARALSTAICEQRRDMGQIVPDLVRVNTQGQNGICFELAPTIRCYRTMTLSCGRGASVSRRTEKVQALRGLLDVETRPAPEPRFATDWLT